VGDVNVLFSCLTFVSSLMIMPVKDGTVYSVSNFFSPDAFSYTTYRPN